MPDPRSKKLGRYHDKRAPGITNEPFGDERPARSTSDTSGAYVVHLHDATRRHYDVRLELGGVLLSFAVPKGPSLDPAEKVLAVKTEDHPIEYLEFEDVIPDGQYGAGSMICWDRGLVTYLEGPAEDELAVGKLHVELRGMKLRGRWAFVRLAKGEKGNESSRSAKRTVANENWLLFKKQDEHANPARSLVDELPWSVLSGLTVDDLARRDEIGVAIGARARKAGARRTDAIAALVAPAASPLLAAHPGAGAPPRGGALYDPELDGVRVLATRDGDVVRIHRWTTDAAQAIEGFYPDVVRALRALPGTRLVLDGELVAFDATGRPSLALLAQRVSRVAKGKRIAR